MKCFAKDPSVFTHARGTINIHANFQNPSVVAVRCLVRRLSSRRMVPCVISTGLLSAIRVTSLTGVQLKQVVTNRISQFFAVDSEKVEGKDPLVVRFTGERLTYVGRTETERKPYQYRVTLQHVERTQQNPYGLVVSSIEQTESPKGQ